MDQRALLDWYDAHARDLPWRRDRHPYKVWLSEVMAQQTRIETMLPYWERFMARWPTVQALADAQLDDVLAAWSGLGYYSRARNLHQAAQQIAEQGAFPDTVDGLRALNGVGPYIASAVASIAFDRPSAVIDGNVERVMARFGAIELDVRTAAGKRAIKALADQSLVPERPGDWNQAVMELGARVCTPRRNPQCDQCPLSAGCRGLALDLQTVLPRKPKKKASPTVQAACLVCIRGDAVLLAQRPGEGLLGGLWEPPGDELAVDEPPEEGLRRSLAERLGITPIQPRPVGHIVHVFSHRRLTLHVFVARIDGAPDGAHYDQVRFVRLDELDSVGISSMARKALELAGLDDQPQQGLFAADSG